MLSFYVLGYNVYFDDVKKKLIELQDSAERSSYSMQERIFPLVTTNYFIYPGNLDELKPIEIVNELGIFGAFVRYIQGSSCSSVFG